MARLSLLSLLVLGSVSLAKQDAFEAKCAQFGDKINLPHVQVNFAEYIAGGTNLSLPDNAPSCGASSQEVTVDLCRVAMAVNTSSSSQITLEAWFPREYKGRFLSTGNGGLSGCMWLSKHYISAITNSSQASNITILHTLQASALRQLARTTDTTELQENPFTTTQKCSRTSPTDPFTPEL